MPTDIVMPQMGESIFEGTITKWLKKPGDKVQRDEPLFEISTDKVDAEIPAPASGVLQDIKVAEGATVQVNTVVGTISADGESAAANPPSRRLAATRRNQLPLKPAPAPNPRRRSHRARLNLCKPRLHMKKKTTLAHLHWSAKSRAKTTSTSRRCPEPDSAAASPSRTSPLFWRRAQQQPRRLLPLRPRLRCGKARCRTSRRGINSRRSRSDEPCAQDHRAAHDRVAPHQRPRPLHVRSGPYSHRSAAQQKQVRLRKAQRRTPYLHALFLSGGHHHAAAISHRERVDRRR